MYTEVMVKFDDLTGENASMKFTADGLADPATFAGLVTVLDGISSAAINGMSFTATDPDAVGTAADGDYANAQDKAVFTFQSVGGEYQISVPAPDEGIFLPDKETVDPSDAGVIAFVAAITANSTDPNGNALTFVNARRERTSAQYK